MKTSGVKSSFFWPIMRNKGNMRIILASVKAMAWQSVILSTKPVLSHHALRNVLKYDNVEREYKSAKIFRIREKIALKPIKRVRPAICTYKRETNQPK